jgi:CubicO group peptidase (beta-lactamase class C family)
MPPPRGDVPGVVVTVVNRDGVLYHEAFGKSSTQRNTPMSKDTIFNIASMTKAVTIRCHLMLADEGKLKLDDDVAKYLPKYKDPVVVSKFNPADGATIRARRSVRSPSTPADAYVRHRLRLRQSDGCDAVAEDRQDRAGSAAAVRSR